MGARLADSLAVEISSLAAAYGMPAREVDGMDALAVRRAMEEALVHARSGAGPAFLEAKTYRFRSHSMADPELYRTRETEVETQGALFLRDIQRFLETPESMAL